MPRDAVSRTANVEGLRRPPVYYYASLLCNLYRNAGLKRCYYFQTSRAQSPFNSFYIWCNMLLTGLHHSPPLPFKFFHSPFISFLCFPPLCAQESRAIIIIIAYRIDNRHNGCTMYGYILLILWLKIRVFSHFVY